MASSSEINNSFGPINQFGGTAYYGSQYQNDETTRRRNEFIQSLSFDSQSSREDDLELNPAAPRTCQWLFERHPEKFDSFVEWAESDTSTYWVHGQPGSGKSTLMKFLADSEDRVRPLLEIWTGERPLAVIKHYFWRAGTPEQKNVSGLLRYLCWQILDEHAELADTVMPENSRQLPQWTVKRLSNLLKSLLETSTTSFFIMIDGLDEFEGEQSAWEQIFRLLSELRELSQVKLCISSRPEAHIRDFFSGISHLDLGLLNSGDLNIAASARLLQVPLFRKHREENKVQAKVLIRSLCKKSDGVFLWLHLALEQLCIGLTRFRESLDQMQLRLSSLERTLDGLFTTLLSQVDPLYHKFSATLLYVCSAQSGRYFYLRGLGLMFATLMDNPNDPRLLACLEGQESINTATSAGCFRELEMRHLDRTAHMLRAVDTGSLWPDHLAPNPGCVSDPRPRPRCLRSVDQCPHGWLSRGFEFLHRSAYDYFLHDPIAQDFLNKRADSHELSQMCRTTVLHAHSISSCLCFEGMRRMTRIQDVVDTIQCGMSDFDILIRQWTATLAIMWIACCPVLQPMSDLEHQKSSDYVGPQQSSHGIETTSQAGIARMFNFWEDLNRANNAWMPPTQPRQALKSLRSLLVACVNTFGQSRPALHDMLAEITLLQSLVEAFSSGGEMETRHKVTSLLPVLIHGDDVNDHEDFVYKIALHDICQDQHLFNGALLEPYECPKKSDLQYRRLWDDILPHIWHQAHHLTDSLSREDRLRQLLRFIKDGSYQHQAIVMSEQIGNTRFSIRLSLSPLEVLSLCCLHHPSKVSRTVQILGRFCRELHSLGAQRHADLCLVSTGLQPSSFASSKFSPRTTEFFCRSLYQRFCRHCVRKALSEIFLQPHDFVLSGVLEAKHAYLTFNYQDRDPSCEEHKEDLDDKMDVPITWRIEESRAEMKRMLDKPRVPRRKSVAGPALGCRLPAGDGWYPEQRSSVPGKIARSCSFSGFPSHYYQHNSTLRRTRPRRTWLS